MSFLALLSVVIKAGFGCCCFLRGSFNQGDFPAAELIQYHRKNKMATTYCVFLFNTEPFDSLNTQR